MSETTDLVGTGTQDAAAPAEATAASGTTGTTRRRGNGLSGMLLPELQRLAGELGITGTGDAAEEAADLVPDGWTAMHLEVDSQGARLLADGSEVSSA